MLLLLLLQVERRRRLPHLLVVGLPQVGLEIGTTPVLITLWQSHKNDQERLTNAVSGAAAAEVGGRNGSRSSNLDPAANAVGEVSAAVVVGGRLVRLLLPAAAADEAAAAAAAAAAACCCRMLLLLDALSGCSVDGNSGRSFSSSFFGPA